MDFRISLAGDLGSGKSTVAEILMKKFDVKRVSAGTIQREVAKSMGMTIEEFNVYMESHPEIDKNLDEGLSKYDSIKGNYIFDSRLAWHFIPSTMSFYLKVDPKVAAQRVFYAERSDETYKSVEHALEKLASRRASETLRYKNFYGLDILDMNNYDCVIDTTNITPDEVVEKIIEAVKLGKKQK